MPKNIQYNLAVYIIRPSLRVGYGLSWQFVLQMIETRICLKIWVRNEEKNGISLNIKLQK